MPNPKEIREEDYITRQQFGDVVRVSMSTIVRMEVVGNRDLQCHEGSTKRTSKTHEADD